MKYKFYDQKCFKQISLNSVIAFGNESLFTKLIKHE